MPAYPHFLELCGAAVGSHGRLDIAAVDGLPIQRSLAFAISGLQLCRDFVEFSRRACCGRGRKNQCAPKRSEEHTSELQSLMRISYAVFCLKKKIEKRRLNTDTISSRTEQTYNT